MAVGVFVPFDLNEPVGLVGRQRGGVGTVGSVYRHPASPGYEADDLVGGDRCAAPGKPDQHVVKALHVEAHRCGVPTGPVGLDDGGRSRRLPVRVLFVEDLFNPANQRLGRDVVFPNRRVQGIQVAVVHRRRNSSQGIPVEDFLDRQADPS